MIEKSILNIELLDSLIPKLESRGDNPKILEKYKNEKRSLMLAKITLAINQKVDVTKLKKD